MLRRTLLIFISLLLVLPFLNAQTGSENGSIGKPEEKILIDFSNLPEGLSLGRWQIKLSGYSDNAVSRKQSILKIAEVDSAKMNTEVKFNKCLGIRIYFEYSHGNDWAQIKPRLPISGFYSKEGEGILRNVGPIKSISMWVSGRNYKHTIEVRMIDPEGNYKCVNFGSLFFRGWRKLTWENSNYLKDIRKRDIVKKQLYPYFSPYLRFDSIVIYKNHTESGGDFITYVKDVRVEYEPALLTLEEAVNDEETWKIQETQAIKLKEKHDKFYDLYFSGSSYEAQYLKEKEQKKKTDKPKASTTTETK